MRVSVVLPTYRRAEVFGDAVRSVLDQTREDRELPAEARAQFLADAGRTYCEAGRLREGRPYLRQSLALDVRPTAVLAFTLSLSGSPGLFDTGVTAAYTVERRLSAE